MSSLVRVIIATFCRLVDDVSEKRPNEKRDAGSESLPCVCGEIVVDGADEVHLEDVGSGRSRGDAAVFTKTLIVIILSKVIQHASARGSL